MKINFSNMVPGKTSGFISGLNWREHIENIVKVKFNEPAKKFKDQIENNTKKIIAYNNLKLLTIDLKNSIENFSNNIKLGGSNNLFSTKTYKISTTGSFGIASNYLGVNILHNSPITAIGNYDVQVKELAKKRVIILGDQTKEGKAFDDYDQTKCKIKDSSEFKLTFKRNNQKPTSIKVKDKTLLELTDLINDSSDKTGFSAKIININSITDEKNVVPKYKLYISSDTGASYNDVEIKCVTQNLRLDLGDLDGVVKEDASNAKILVNNIEQVSQSNSGIVNPFDASVTFDIKNVNQGNEKQTIEIVNDTEKILEGVKDFVKKYNELQAFVEKQLNDPDEKGEGGAFKKEDMISPYLFQLKNCIISPIRFPKKAQMNEEVNELSMLGKEELLSFHDIGIDLADSKGSTNFNIGVPKNYLKLDEKKFLDLLNTRFSEVKSLLQMDFSYKQIGGNDEVEYLSLRNYNDSICERFKLICDGKTNTAIVTEIGDKNKSAIGKYENGIVKFSDESAGIFKGLEIALKLKDNDINNKVEFDMSLIQGGMSKISQLNSLFINSIDGKRLDLNQKKDGYKEQITKFEQKSKDYVARETKRYARLEAKVYQANSILNYIHQMSQVDKKD